MKQVAVRMYPIDHNRAMRRAKREGISFGEFVRLAVYDRIASVFLPKNPKQAGRGRK